MYIYNMYIYNMYIYILSGWWFQTPGFSKCILGMLVVMENQLFSWAIFQSKLLNNRSPNI